MGVSEDIIEEAESHEADLGELSDSIEEDSPLPTNQRELFEKHRHLWPGMIKAPMCVLLTIACMVLANWLISNRGVDEAAMLWTVPLLTLVGYMDIYGDVPTDHDILSDLLNVSEEVEGEDNGRHDLSHPYPYVDLCNNVAMFDVPINLKKDIQKKIVKRGHCLPEYQAEKNRGYLIIIILLSLWIRESDNNLMIINGRRLPEKHSHAVVFINKVIVILPLYPEKLWLDLTSNPPAQDHTLKTDIQEMSTVGYTLPDMNPTELGSHNSSLLGSHYSSLVCPKLCGGVVVSLVPVVYNTGAFQCGDVVSFLRSLSATLHPGNFLALEVKQKLARMYGNMMLYTLDKMSSPAERKIQLCHDVISSLSKRNAGLSTWHTAMLTELAKMSDPHLSKENNDPVGKKGMMARFLFMDKVLTGVTCLNTRSNRVQSTDLKDPKVEIVAGIAVRDNVYQNNVDHTENQDILNLIHKSSELKQLVSDWEKLSVVSLDSGKLILRPGQEVQVV